MAINKEVTFTDAVTVVDAEWLNLLQEHLASLVTLEIDTPTATQLRINAGNDDEVASVYIDGEQRFRDTSVSHTFVSEPSATYDVYVTAPDGVDTFSIEVTTGSPSEAKARKVATVTWNGAAISAYRMLEGRNVSHDHSDLDGAGEVDHADVTDPTSGDPHTQYILPDGSRPFIAQIEGVTPTLAAHLATKGYIDGITVPGLPIGTILPYAGGTLPGGWLLCDGASYDTTAQADLFAVTAYAYGGSASNFNVPDLAEAFPLGKAAAGTGSTLGGTGGSADHTHTQPTHTHTMAAHTHGTASHTHSTPTTGNPSANHSHTQGSTGSDGSHTHTGPSHSHTDGSLAQSTTSNEVVGVANSSQGSIGVYGESDLDQSSDSSSHSHGDGSLDGVEPVVGTSASATASHTHIPSGGNSYQHTHNNGAITGSTGSAGTGATGSTGSHTHTNPSTSTSSNHTHGGGTTGGASPTTDSGGGAVSGAGGDDATGSSEAPFIVLNYMIRAS